MILAPMLKVKEIDTSFSRCSNINLSFRGYIKCFVVRYSNLLKHLKSLLKNVSICYTAIEDAKIGR